MVEIDSTILFFYRIVDDRYLNLSSPFVYKMSKLSVTSKPLRVMQYSKRKILKALKIDKALLNGTSEIS